VGSLLYSGIFQRDFPLVQGAVIMIGILIVLANFVVDITYAYIDPRIRLSR
jgi:ABC-type dipeptide/oligopeptide/nickel transport system permease component